MSDLTDLQAARTAAIAAYTASIADPRPTYKIEGEMVQATEYRAGLLSEIKSLDELIAAEELATGEGESFFIEQSQGFC